MEHKPELERESADIRTEELTTLSGITARIPEQFEILESLGVGGTGVVYKARNRYTNQLVAIKVLKLSSPSSTFIQRFEREAQVASAFNHPNCVRINDYGVLDGAPYLVMEYVPGIGLDRLLAERGHLPQAMILAIGKQVAEALAAAQDAGIVHRDLKPSNIIVQFDDKEQPIAKILDFGLAKITDESIRLTQTGEVLGTPLYMSPEQFSSAPTDTRSDIYSFGAVLYECATGAPPHVADSPFAIMHKRFNEQLPSFSKELAISPQLEAVVMKCLELDVEKRYQLARELADDLELIARGMPPSLKIKSTRKLPSRKMVLSLIAAATFVVLSAGAIMQLTASQNHQKPPQPVVTKQPRHASSVTFNEDEGFRQWLETHPEANQVQLILGVTDRYTSLLQNMKRLETVIIDTEDVTDYSFVDHIPTLRRLAVNNLTSEKLTPKFWQALSQIPSLHILDLRFRQRSAVVGKEIKGPLSNGNLQTLFLVNATLTDECLSEIANCKHLKELDLARSNATEKGLTSLSRLKLATLELSGTQSVSNRVVAHLTAQMPSVTALWIKNCAISDQTLEHISRARNIRSLLLGWNNISDRGGSALANLTELRQLDLIETPVTDISIKALSRCHKLKELYLYLTAVTDDCVQDLVKLKDLRVLDVRSTKLSDKAIQRLSAMPSLQVLYVSKGRQIESKNRDCRIDNSGRDPVQHPLAE